jgi:hypothetical protein
MELALTSVYWTIDTGGWSSFQSTNRMPRWTTMTTRILNLNVYRDYMNAMVQAGEFDVAKNVDPRTLGDFHHTISAAVHGHPGTWNIVDWGWQPTPSYSFDAFDAWSDLYEAVQHSAYVWLFVAHPMLLKSVELQEPGACSRVLDSHELDFFRSI